MNKMNAEPRRQAVVDIAGRLVGAGHPAFVIAEAGSNHGRSLDQALRLVDVAVEAGADAVKFQTFSADRIAACTDTVSARIDLAGATTLNELYERLALPLEWHQRLRDHCRASGILFLSTPFDPEAVRFLDDLGMPAFKIASLELVDLPLIREAARRGKPMIISTGLSGLAEVEEALGACEAAGNSEVALLHCALRYPAEFRSVNLAAMDTLRHAFGTPVGYSDHTPGLAVPLAAVARGANVIEKHFTLDRALPGPDHAFSLEPQELRDMVRGIREVEAAIGSPHKGPSEDEMDALRYRRSLYARVEIPEGTTITADMLAVLRPGDGLMPRYLDVVIGRTARRSIRAHEPITWDKI